MKKLIYYAAIQRYIVKNWLLCTMLANARFVCGRSWVPAQPSLATSWKLIMTVCSQAFGIEIWKSLGPLEGDTLCTLITKTEKHCQKLCLLCTLIAKTEKAGIKYWNIKSVHAHPRDLHVNPPWAFVVYTSIRFSNIQNSSDYDTDNNLDH